MYLNMSCRGGGLHLSGGPGDDLAHREAAEETLCHRLPGVGAQHRPRLHQTGEEMLTCVFSALLLLVRGT